MNCKPNDLALIVRAINPANNGKMVTCIRVVLEDEHKMATKFGPVWLIDREIEIVDLHTRVPYRKAPYVFDYQLMPVRPGDAENEFLETLVKSVQS